MTADDIPAALGLSTQSNWNQIEADWRRLLTLFGDRCLVGCLDGQVVATGTLAVYGGDIAWIGMILVDRAQRGQGLGRRMFHTIVDVGDKQGLSVMGLDATDQGRPLYLKHDFVDRGAVNRWRADAPVSENPQAAREVRPLRRDDWPALLELDKASVNVDRGPLLDHLARERGALALMTQDGDGVGFARRGREATHLGPIVASNSQSAATLFDALVAAACKTNPATPLMIDTPTDSAIDEVMPLRGFEIQRRLTRMTRPGEAPLPLLGSNVHALGGFELG